MELGPVTKLDKKNNTTSKKFDDQVMSAKCDVIVFFPIYGQFVPMVYKIYIFINYHLLSYKISKQN